MSIDKELQEILKKNLPEATAGALRERLESLEQTEKDYKKALKTIEAREESVKSLTKEIDILNGRVLTKQELDELRDRLHSQEALLRDQETVLFYKEQMLNLKEQHAQERVNDHKEMFSTVFRNTTLRNTIMGTTPLYGGEYIVPTGYNGEQLRARNPDNIVPNTEVKTQTEE